MGASPIRSVRQFMSNEKEKTKIKVEPGTEGQNTYWPGESPVTKESGQTIKDGKEEIKIPVVR